MDWQYEHMYDFYYFFFLVLLGLVTTGIFFLCKKKGQRFTHITIEILVWANFALHFLKQFLPGYPQLWPEGWVDSSFPNLCATLIVVAPFIYTWGTPTMKDYMFYIGFVSGVAVHFYPTGVFRLNHLQGGWANPLYLIEALRFYFCHSVLVITAVLMVGMKLHKLDYRRLKWMPLAFGAVLSLVALHSIFYGPLLQLKNFPHDWLGADGILYRANYHYGPANQSMAFGPQPGVMEWLDPIAEKCFIPYLMVFWVDGTMYYTPVIWILPLIALGTLIAGPLMCLPFEHRHMKLDFEAWKQRRAMKKKASSQNLRK